MSRAMSGKAVAQPAIPLMKSRRRIAGSLPRYADDGFQRRDYSRDLRSAEWGSMINLRCKSLESPMSALGQKQTFSPSVAISAPPPKADIADLLEKWPFLASYLYFLRRPISLLLNIFSFVSNAWSILFSG
jgi:hypothetical protein